MSRISAGKKQSNTKKAIRDFKKWNKERTPVFYEDGSQLTLKDDEVFVPIYDFYQGKINKNYYVSNYGNVISFKQYGNIYPRAMTQNTVAGGYQIVGENWRVHKLVWFSFMADAIVNGKDLAQSYGVEIASLSELKKLCKIEDNKIHHEDTDVTNNALKNLELLPDDIHNMLHNMNRADSEDKKWDIFLQNRKKISNYYSDKASIFFIDDEISAEAVEQQVLLDSFSPKVKAALNDAYWMNIKNWILNQILLAVGVDFFTTDKYAYASVNGSYAFFKFSMDGDYIKCDPITPLETIPDIIYDEGKLMLTNYVTGDDD